MSKHFLDVLEELPPGKKECPWNDAQIVTLYAWERRVVEAVSVWVCLGVCVGKGQGSGTGVVCEGFRKQRN